MPTTSPDEIYYASTSTPSNDVVVSAAEASSVQAAFAKRSRYSYSWANASGRTAQSGMQVGSLGYQQDTNSEYIFDGTTWQLSTPYMEFTTTKSIPAATPYTTIGAWVYQSGTSTSSTMAYSGTSSQILLSNPGLYLVTLYSVFPTTTGRTFAQISTTLADDTGIRARTAIPIGEDRLSVSVLIRATSALFPFYVLCYQNNGAAQSWTSRLSIARLA